MSSSAVESAVLAALAAGSAATPALCRELGASPADVEAAVASLREKGLAVKTTADGFALPAGFAPLDADLIERQLNAACQSRIAPLEVVYSLGSTNDALAQRPGEAGCLLAEHQSSGRGRSGRRWLSPLGASLYLSVKRRFPGTVRPAGCLALGVGQALAARLTGQGVPARVKWPNDIYVAGRKLAGILLESRVDGGGRWQVVIGVGVNYDLPRSVLCDPELRATDVRSQCAVQAPDRNTLAAAVIEAVDGACEAYVAEGAGPIRDAWADWDAFPRAMVRCQYGGRSVSGQSRGVDEQGRLLVALAGETVALNAGEVEFQALSDVDSGRG